jgi:hypothetical protein
MNAYALALVAASAVTALAAACSVVSETRIGIVAPDGSEQSFGPVADYLDHRCGTLDCHGQSGRNLRIWGCEGMRLDAGDVPFCGRAQGGRPTTPDEHQATYRSLVGLEPTVMTTVYGGCSGGPTDDAGVSLYPPGSSCHPELLTFIRKARGTEAHKGGQLICTSPPCPGGVASPSPFDPQDVCLVTWIEGHTDPTACSNAINAPNFPTDAGPE